MRRVPYALALLTALAAVPAHAVNCPLLKDDSSEIALHGVVGDQFDLVSADVASGKKTVVVVLRVNGLDRDALTLNGGSWSVGWQIKGVDYTATATRNGPSVGDTYAGTFAVGDKAATAADLKVDKTKSTFTWTLPRKSLPGLAKAGQKFDHIHAAAISNGRSMDTMITTTTYTDRTKGCVPAS